MVLHHSPNKKRAKKQRAGLASDSFIVHGVQRTWRPMAGVSMSRNVAIVAAARPGLCRLIVAPLIVDRTWNLAGDRGPVQIFYRFSGTVIDLYTCMDLSSIR